MNIFFSKANEKINLKEPRKTITQRCTPTTTLRDLLKKLHFPSLYSIWFGMIFVLATTIHKIFETNSSFHVKQCTTGKVQFLFFSSFLLVLTKFSFWEEDWALGYNSMIFWDFPDISFGNSWGNSYISYLLLIITLYFTCGERKNYSTIRKSQNIMNMVLVRG